MPLSPTPPSDVLTLLARGMGPELHWFPGDVQVTRLASVLVGMANTSGGTVILGVAPRSAQVQGVADPAEAIDRVFQACLLADPPLVLPVPVVHILHNAGVKLLWITVPSGLPNVYNLSGSYLGRLGRQTEPLSARRLRELLIERGAIQFEARVPPGASLDDLDLERLQEYVSILRAKQGLPAAEASPAIDLQALLQRGCVQRAPDGSFSPTYAGILLFGRSPQQWLPNANILAARFSGPTFSDQYVKHDISGTLPDQLRQVEAFIRDNLRTLVRMKGLAHEEVLEHPFEAVREVVVNAIAHRDYNFQGDNTHVNIFSDRLEVQSPGVLPGPVTLENLLEARFSRNAVIFQVLYDLGFVERLGYGLDRVLDVVRQNNLRAPRFEEVAGCFKVTLYPVEEIQASAALLPILAETQGLALNSRQEAAIAYLSRQRRISSSSYQELCPDVSAETLRRDLADLVNRGILIKVGDKRATYYILKK